MRVHILGICGTFMGGVAALAQQMGDAVSGADQGIYPPMSTQLESLGIPLTQGYAAEDLPADGEVDQWVIGNALSRGNPAVEALLNRGVRYFSGAQWLAERILCDRSVLAVAGTHGKTTTSSMCAHILEACDQSPGFLIGGVPHGFSVSARLGDGQAFVVEADEYDTAFFDKRSKFVHYRPNVAILNNLEFDHADIFPDLAAIERQFHHLVRTVPGSGRLIVRAGDEALQRVLQMGCWTPIDTFGLKDEDVTADWQAELLNDAGTHFAVWHQGTKVGDVIWSSAGRHNVLNATAAIAACHAMGVAAVDACAAMNDFAGVKRRLDVLFDNGTQTIVDDFAHHPTAISETLRTAKARWPDKRIVVALEPRSNSMRMGAHADMLAPSLNGADQVHVLVGERVTFDADKVLADLAMPYVCHRDADVMLAALMQDAAQPNTVVLFMSNGGFAGLQHKLTQHMDANA